RHSNERPGGLDSARAAAVGTPTLSAWWVARPEALRRACIACKVRTPFAEPQGVPPDRPACFCLGGRRVCPAVLPGGLSADARVCPVFPLGAQRDALPVAVRSSAARVVLCADPADGPVAGHAVAVALRALSPVGKPGDRAAALSGAGLHAAG